VAQRSQPARRDVVEAYPRSRTAPSRLRKGRLLLASTLPRFQATHMLGPRSTERREALYAQADGVALVGLAVHPPAQVDSTSGAHDPGVGSAATKSDRVNWSGLRDLDSTVAPGRSTRHLEFGGANTARLPWKGWLRESRVLGAVTATSTATSGFGPSASRKHIFLS
jgi:hypothetical protein